MFIDFDDPFDCIEKLTKIMEWISNHVPIWLIIVIGLLVAVFAPVIVALI